jgi:hypothetical protein
LISSNAESDLCPFCEQGTLQYVREYSFLDENGDEPFELPADVCDTCSEYMLSEKNMSKLMNEKDRRAGLHYRRTVVEDNKLVVYNLH